MRKRNHTVTIRMNKEEYELLQSKDLYRLYGLWKDKDSRSRNRKRSTSSEKSVESDGKPP